MQLKYTTRCDEAPVTIELVEAYKEDSPPSATEADASSCCPLPLGLYEKSNLKLHVSVIDVPVKQHQVNWGDFSM